MDTVGLANHRTSTTSLIARFPCIRTRRSLAYDALALPIATILRAKLNSRMFSCLELIAIHGASRAASLPMEAIR